MSGFRTFCYLLLLSVITLIGCYQGRPSKEPPIHLIPNMDSQPKYNAQSESEFFADGATMRQPVVGTVARGYLRADDEYYRGKTASGNFVREAPVPVTMAVLKRGQERFSIYCTVCHGAVGDGKGIVAIKNVGLVPPPSFHEDNLMNIEDGHLFDVMTNGIRTMPSYKHQVSVEDRWAIVRYIRALQRSQRAKAKDVPREILSTLATGAKQ